MTGRLLWWRVLVVSCGWVAALSCAGRQPASPPSPLLRRVSPFGLSDTTVSVQTARWNPGNQIVEITVVDIWLHGAVVGTCVFGVAADSTLVSFPGNKVDCGRTYEWWTSQRRTTPPPGRH